MKLGMVEHYSSTWMGLVEHTLNPSIWGQRQEDLCVQDQPGLQSQFQSSQSCYTEKPCLEKPDYLYIDKCDCCYYQLGRIYDQQGNKPLCMSIYGGLSN